MTKCAERIKQALALRGLRPAELCLKASIAKASMSMYLSGRYLPKHDKLAGMARVLQVSEQWLLGEDVPMEPAPTSTISDERLKFALFSSTEGVTDEMLEEVKEFARQMKLKSEKQD